MTRETLTDIDLPLPGRRVGKVRISYDLPDGKRLFITTDRLSAFDRLVAAVPFKGQVLNQLAMWWFEHTRDIVPNHALSTPDPNALVAREARPLPVEVVVRGHITGVTSTSLWKRYAEGERTIYGYRMPEGLKKNSPLPEAIITPTTKAEAGQHDEPITCAEVAERGLVEPTLWERVQRTALQLFARGQETARRAGLILADTKYEFGLDRDGQLMLIDEAHTPDSSRFWIADTYDGRFAAGAEPESTDKEIIRRALADAGYGGDGALPQLPAEVWEETSRRYVQTYEALTGQKFVAGSTPIADRIKANLEAAGIL
ncbi:MAG: phosphoribosylaminoimidazolesuccinocarboxamide synthase [Chthoniobacterales bacterium]|nr:phosphoribosylaminoimidazolesuccinocarboxamide synthase [Chthoniobacterales bacterium]